MSPLHENYIELHIFSKTSNVRNVIKVNLLKSFCNSCKTKTKKQKKQQQQQNTNNFENHIFSRNHFL